ncbi:MULTISPECIES: hypothetical protein [Streptomyces]|uniref:hypothetical protein n=1 Tax=Streptomyces TaxID=1883 RepID=UPI002252A041|nr:hypothetical protein [Streptomyces sp. NBC_00160]MCX5308161.1 hypothetical protein [Streptomyces sp. NBC_00160]
MERAPHVARGGGAAVVLTLLIALVEAVEVAAASWHRAQEFRAQAKAAAEAAVLLRAAAGLTGTRSTGPKAAHRPGPARTR